MRRSPVRIRPGAFKFPEFFYVISNFDGFLMKIFAVFKGNDR